MGRKATAKRDKVERVIRFPAPLYAWLQDRREREQRSIQQQVIYYLEQARERDGDA